MKGRLADHQVKAVVIEGHLRGIAQAEIHLHAGRRRILAGNLHKGFADIQPGDLETAQFRQLDAEITRPRRNLEHPAAGWQLLRQFLGHPPVALHVFGSILRIPARNRPFHTQTDIAFICSVHFSCLLSSLICPDDSVRLGETTSPQLGDWGDERGITRRRGDAEKEESRRVRL